MNYYLEHHQAEYANQQAMEDPIAYKASTNSEVMYFHQAMQVPGKDTFMQAAINKINAHIEGKHWEIIKKEDVPEDTKVIDSVWDMQRKRDIKTRELYKHKARLNLHGGQQVKGIHFNET